jgi:O-succinylbenzoic acid--CoA ligase
MRGAAVDGGVRLVMPTSGTSGAPKLAELDDDGIGAALEASAGRIGARPEDRWVCCLPLGHIGGMLVALRGVVQGVPVSVQRGFDVESFATEASAGARFASLVPTALRRLLDAEVDLRAFGAILVGGAGLDPALRERAEAAGVNVVQTYGLTESCGGVVYDGVPLQGTAVRIAGPTGEIVLRGPSLMRGYRFDPGATSAAFEPGGWLRTGDGGALADGRLSVHGRLAEVIVTGGEKVWPATVERALSSHPAVLDAMVTGRPDDEWGQRVVAFVVPADAESPPDLGTLRDHVARFVPRFAAPRELVVVRDLPRTPSGKPAPHGTAQRTGLAGADGKAT